MKQIDNPLVWVQFAYASMPTRNMTIWLIISCVLGAFYCVPWLKYTDKHLIAKLFLLMIGGLHR